jgi:CubicO group peptidase (beta-lactamase class C family)
MSKSLFLKSLTILGGALIVSCSSPTPQKTQHQNTQQKAVETLLAEWDNADAPGVAIAVSLDGKLEYSLGLGVANLEYGVPITPQTPFAAASLSKQFTAFSILLLEEDGLLSLDDDVQIYLPALKKLDHTITIRQMLNHTSGLRETGTLLRLAGWQETDAVTQEQANRLAYRQTGLNFEPGSKFQYNNLGYLLLAQVVEHVSGQPYSEFTQTRIFGPIGMTNTHFHDDNTQIVTGRAYSYYTTNDGFSKGNLNHNIIGSTGLFTTAEDLVKWAQNFETPIAGSKDIIETMKERGVLNSGTKNIYAMGQETNPYKGFTTWSHGGRDAGYRSFLLRIPEQKFSVSIMSNASQFDTAKTAYGIADIYLKDKPQFIEKPVSKIQYPTEEQLERYVGNYELLGGLIFSVTRDSDTLYLSTIGSSQNGKLEPASPTEFIVNPTLDRSLIFVADEDGEVRSLKYKLGMHGKLDAPRIELAPFDKASVHLGDYVGRYYSKELDTEYVFTIVEGELVARNIQFSDMPMTPYQKDTFITGQTQLKMAFIRDDASNVIGCHISGTYADRILFEKIVH